MSAPTNSEDASSARGATEPKAATRERSPLLRYVGALVVIAGLFGTVAFFFVGQDDMPPPRQVRELTAVNTVPLPPPPPPPPMPEQKMIEQPKMADPEFKEEKQVDKPRDEPVRDAKNDEPPGPLSLDAKAVGPGDLFNLGSKVGGSPYGGGGGGGGSRWGWYSTIVTDQATAAMRANPRTRNMATQIQVRLWADSSGRVTRVTISPSTGDPELDAIIRDEVLGRLTLREPPPRDMPMPVVTRVTARRPS